LAYGPSKLGPIAAHTLAPKPLPRNRVRELIAYFVDNLLPDLVFEEFGVLKQAKAKYAKPQ